MLRLVCLAPFVLVVACGGAVSPEGVGPADGGAVSSACPTSHGSLAIDVRYLREGTTPAKGSIEAMVKAVPGDSV
jgi:hypothetical protein